MNVDREFAEAVATGLGMRTMPAPMPKVLETDVTPEVDASHALSLMARRGDGSIKARRIAILVADGAENRSLEALARELLAAGAVPRFGARLGEVTMTGGARQVDATVETMPSVLWDAVVLPDGDDAVEQLGIDGRVLEFIGINTGTASRSWRLGRPRVCCRRPAFLKTLVSGHADPGLLLLEGDDSAGITAFIAAIAKHRHFERETDPPRVLASDQPHRPHKERQHG